VSSTAANTLEVGKTKMQHNKKEEVTKFLKKNWNRCI
jgi:hypothetical protein